MGNLVEIAAFFDPEEAYCARGYLQSYGVDAILQNEHHLATAPWLRVALGGYRLMAPSEQVREAQELLEKVQPLKDSSLAGKKNWIWLPVAFMSAVPFMPKPKTGPMAFVQFMLLMCLYALTLYVLYYWFWWVMKFAA